jgi:hypothetical protein
LLYSHSTVIIAIMIDHPRFFDPFSLDGFFLRLEELLFRSLLDSIHFAVEDNPSLLHRHQFFVFLSHLLLQVLFDLGVYMHQVSIVVDLHIPRVFHNCQTLGVALEKSFRFVEIWPVVRLIISYGFGAVVRVLRDLRKVVLCAKRHLHRVFIDRNFI